MTDPANSDSSRSIQELSRRANEAKDAVDWWNERYVWFVAGGVVVAAVVFFAQFKVIRKSGELSSAQDALGVEKDRLALIDSKAKDVQIAAAHAEGEAARRDAAKAGERAAMAGQKAAEANERAAALERDAAAARLKIADAQRSASEANERAAILESEAASARLEVEKLKAKQAPWEFGPEQREQFSAALSKAPRGRILIQYSTADGTRGSDFADALNRVLGAQGLGFDVWGYIGPFTSAGPRPLVGIQVSIKYPTEADLQNALIAAFKAIGIDAQPTVRSPQDATYEGHQVVISVGIRPTE